MAGLVRSEVPTSAGVYALYRDDARGYVGKASSLRSRVWGNHSARGRSMSNSAMRRNVAEHLGYGAAQAIKDGVVVLTQAQLDAVRAWLDGCVIAWIECLDEPAAKRLEDDLKGEFMPPLTKR